MYRKETKGMGRLREEFRLWQQKIWNFHASAIANDNDFLIKIMLPEKYIPRVGDNKQPKCKILVR
jgi:hypothetical protein